MEFESRSLKKLSSVVPSGKCAVAVSGGVDSIVLMHLLAVFHRKNPSAIPVVLTVNHGFRPEAAKEVDFVKKQANALGLECHILHWSGCVDKKSQAIARDIRYGLLTRCCEENSLKVLLTAHTKNDQAETVLLRLERGSGVDGLAGMWERSTIGNVVVTRPLLNCTRREIVEYAKRQSLSWIDDPSNNNPKYRRTIYRRAISECEAPENAIDRLHRTAIHMQNALRCILHYVSLAVDNCVEFSPLGCVIIKREAFLKLHVEVARRLLLFLFITVGNKPLKPRYQKFDKAFQSIWERGRFASFTLHGCKVLVDRNENIVIAREVERIVPLHYHVDTSILQWDSRFELSVKSMKGAPFGLVENKGVGADEENMFIIPLGTRTIPCKLQQYKNVNKYVVRGLPVLVKGDKVLAYPQQNNNICGIPVVVIRRVLLRERVFSLICSQLGL
ncbi:MAG: tRNA lysidine(34) synthetase TilS [Aaplasma endosymbiont of Hyalomma asiaticum]